MTFHSDYETEKMTPYAPIDEDIALSISNMVAIPAYNEELTIGSVVARARMHADKVVVIDDGSSDRTAEVAALVGAEVIRHSSNEGYGSAIRECFAIARACDADVLVTLDGDGQHDPDDIPQLIMALQKTGADIIVGSRFTDTTDSTIPRYRKLGMRLLDHATKLGSGLQLIDSQSGFRAYSRKALDAIDLRQSGMGVGSEILFRAADSNLKIEEVGIVTRYDGIRESRTGPLRHGLDVINSIIRLVSQKHPIFFFAVPGIAFLLTGVVSLSFRTIEIYSLTQDFMTFYAVAALICVGIGLFGVLTGLVLWSVQDIGRRTG